jgi:hypothetical protein
MNTVDIKKLNLTKSLKYNYFNKLNKYKLKSKDLLLQEITIFKIKKSLLFKRYRKHLKRKISYYKKFSKVKGVLKKKTYRKLFRNKSYNNKKENFFLFNNIYHKFKQNTINLF